MDDSTLVAQAVSRDVAAFSALARQHQSRVRGLLLRLTRGNHAAADDLAQETFLEAWRGIAGFRGESSFSTWLYRIAYSRFLMGARKRKPDEPLGDWQGEAASGESATLARIDLERAMAKLSAPESAALTLCYALGLSNTEAALALNMPLGTLKSHVLRGRDKLKAILGDPS
ncbi:MAG TPA: sigma-70 family RNA polymerase sigma factor [Rhizomicrobium sp.]|jgi:RNA polymerase sigma factor (sigma-70 family)|nr:sigma-70 family RNA polymerase sigma factor [Rhizomicrobium sp.]